MRHARVQRILAALALVAGATAVLPGSVAGAKVPTEAADNSTARAVVRSVENRVLGVVTIQRNRDGSLLVGGRLAGLTPGFHGFHIHGVGICDPNATDASGTVVPFASAGGHLNPAGTGHGHHAGDLPMLYVNADGAALSLTQTDAATFAAILDADGGAFIVHAAADNAAHIPARYASATGSGPDAATLATGDAGGRVGCGVITRG